MKDSVNSQSRAIACENGAVKTLPEKIEPEAGAFYVMDRAYIDFERLFVLKLNSAFFVVRTKSNVLLQWRCSHAVDKSTGVRSDQTVILSSIKEIKHLVCAENVHHILRIMCG